MFAGIARRYDLLNHLLSCHIDKLWRRAAVRAAQIGSGSHVLDVCAGTGDLSFALARKGAKVIGADFTPEMIVLAHGKRFEGHLSRRHVRFAVADTLSLPFASNRFDAVSVAFGIRNVADWRRGLAEMVRVAKPGGRIVVLEFSQPKNWLFRKLFFFYFLRVVPCIGKLVSRDPQAYRYLPDSVLAFATPQELGEGMAAAGLGEIRVQRLTGGIASLIVGTKLP